MPGVQRVKASGGGLPARTGSGLQLKITPARFVVISASVIVIHRVSFTRTATVQRRVILGTDNYILEKSSYSCVSRQGKISWKAFLQSNRVEFEVVVKDDIYSD